MDFKVIDGKSPYGFWTNPNEQISSIQLSIHGNEIIIPDSAFKDIYNPNLKAFQISYDKRGNIYLYTAGGDGAVGYEVAWIFKNRKFLKRYVDTSYD
jgi:hypothetical protein